MFARFLRTVLTFVALVVAYQVYVLAAVPMLEPALSVKQAEKITDADKQKGRQALHKYQRLLAAYFPENHWSLAKPPKVIESGPAMLVFDKYKRYDDGRVDLSQCAILIFPTPHQEGLPPPRDAIILEASQGAKLQFNENFRLDRGEIGQITRGEFPGKVTIRSGMRAAGPEDDLWIETSDLLMNTKRLYTSSQVRFRLGKSVGGGRELEIRFLEEEHTRQGKLNIAGIESLEVLHDIRARMFFESDGLLPIAAKPRNLTTELAPPTQKTNPPVKITCAGSFHFDFLRTVISFDQDVEVWQLNPNGPSDQLSCQQLDIHLAQKQRPPDISEEPPFQTGSHQAGPLGKLEPYKLVALGNPVVIVSPSKGAEARGRRVQLMLRDRKISIEGGREVMLVEGPNVLRAPTIEYQHPPEEAVTKIGNFRAAGPGLLQYTPNPNRPEQTLEVSWQQSVRLARHNGQPVLSLQGKPRLTMAPMGSLGAETMQITLRELEADSTNSKSQNTLQVLPDRMTAEGSVTLDSPELTARTEKLVATFQIESNNLEGSSGESGPQLFPSGGGRGVETDRGTAYHLDADSLELKVALRGRRAVPTDLSCIGHVLFREAGAGSAREQPLAVRGGQLWVHHLDSPDTTIRITGKSPDRLPATTQEVVQEVAQVEARGVTVTAAQIDLDKRNNRLWSDGPGEATMLVQRDLQGGRAETPTPMKMRWRGGLNFDGRQVVLNRDVLIESGEDWLRCDQVTARLTANVSFQEQVNPETIDLAEVVCEGHVVMDHQSRDEVGLTSRERMKLASLAFHLQTGAIRGIGPGSLRSVHYAASLEKAARPGPPSTGQQLHFLRVDFQRGLEGNFLTREIAITQRVRTVYGPVDAWEQELDLLRPESLPPGSITLTCEELRLNEDPMAAQKSPRLAAGGRRPMGAVQMSALRNVRIEGESPQQGTFTAQADRASYEQAKELLILEGGARSPATLWHQQQLGGQLTQSTARKYLYWRTTGEFKVDGLLSGDFSFPERASRSAGNSTRRDPRRATGSAPFRQ